MKLIKAIVRPNKVDEVKGALEKLQISGMTVTEVRGHGKQKGHTAIYRGQEYNVSLLPKMEIEVVIPDAIVPDAVKAITEAAGTGEVAARNFLDRRRVVAQTAGLLTQPRIFRPLACDGRRQLGVLPARIDERQQSTVADDRIDDNQQSKKQQRQPDNPAGASVPRGK